MTDKYQDLLKRQLDVYRRDTLNISEEGVWSRNGLAYGHILPKLKEQFNILEPFRQEIYASVIERGDFKPHQFFHHLNSSQAFALNLFWPFYLRSPQALAAAFSCDAVIDLKLEHVEDQAEGTNVDVIWRTTAVSIYCEVKLSESDFGTAADDCAHRYKLGKTYVPDLTGQVDEARLEPKEFFASYQVFRNLWLVARKGHELVDCNS